MHEIPQLDRQGLRDFGLTTGAIFVGLFGLLMPSLFDLNMPLWPWVLGGGLALWGLVLPMSLNPVYRGWMRFGLLLNKITTPIILGIVFYLVIFPIGFTMRLCGWDALSRRLDAAAESYRTPSVKATKESMERPF